MHEIQALSVQQPHAENMLSKRMSRSVRFIAGRATVPPWVILLLATVTVAANAAVDVTGDYTGTAQGGGSTETLSVAFTQSGTSVTGTMSVSPANCFLSFQFSGTVSGTMLAGSFTDGRSTINISGTVSGNEVKGGYSIPASPCAKGSGSFTLIEIATPTPSETPNPTPTPTPTPGSCVGDCNGDGQVTVNELIQMVNIALGNAAVSTCTAGDANGDGEITVNEIVAGVNNALNGCPT